MKKARIITYLLSVFAMIFIIAVANADVIITMKNGEIHRVKVDPKDVKSISFEEKTKRKAAITWDFETGNLEGWTATGTAFQHQPTYGDNPSARNRGQASNHQGNYWIGGYENRPSPQAKAGEIQGDAPTGTLSSEPFTIQHPNISFLVGGGCDINMVRVELVVERNVLRQTTGKCTETMSRVEWKVSELIGKKAFIRLVDNHTGGWGHINFDDVKFY